MTQNGQRFKDKVVIVTGAAKGIGRAIALRFGSEGAHVIVNDVDTVNAEATTQSIIANGGSALAGIADVSDKSQVDRLFDTTLERFGTVDVLVNNASLTNTARHFLEADETWWDKILAVNLKAAYLCSQRAAQVMARVGAHVRSKGHGRRRAGRRDVEAPACDRACVAVAVIADVELPGPVRIVRLQGTQGRAEGASQATGR